MKEFDRVSELEAQDPTSSDQLSSGGSSTGDKVSQEDQELGKIDRSQLVFFEQAEMEEIKKSQKADHFKALIQTKQSSQRDGETRVNILQHAPQVPTPTLTRSQILKRKKTTMR